MFRESDEKEEKREREETAFEGWKERFGRLRREAP